MTEQPDSQGMETYLAVKRNQAIICNAAEFAVLAKQHLGEVPLFHAAAYRHEVPEVSVEEGIIINREQFQTTWGQDYSEFIPYEIEHEAMELWLTKGKRDVDPFGRDHMLAIRAALGKALRDGKLDKYLAFRREVAKQLELSGDDHIMEELGYYREVAEELRSGN